MDLVDIQAEDMSSRQEELIDIPQEVTTEKETNKHNLGISGRTSQLIKHHPRWQQDYWL